IRNRNSVYVLDDDVLTSVRKRTTIDQPRDVWVFQIRENLSLEKESGLNARVQCSGSDHFYSYVFVIAVVGSPCKEHRPHAAVAKLAFNAVRPNQSSRLNWTQYRFGCDFARPQESSRFTEQLRIVPAGAREEGLALLRRSNECPIDKRLQALIAFA